MTSANCNEASTRTELIDTQLAHAGWSKSRRTLIAEVLLQAAESDDTYQQGEDRHTQEKVRAYLQMVQDDLVPTEPHYEVHSVLCTAMLEQSRLATWQTELGLVT